MKYIIDHDYHIHTKLSSCSTDPEQTPENVLAYAQKNGLRSICLTDHYWDSAVEGASSFYKKQNYDHIAKSLPLPSKDGIRFLFGCETDIRGDMTLGIPKERFDCFDMIIIPTTHLHMRGFTVSEDGSESCEQRAKLWCERLEAVLNMDLPFHKIGIAHLACSLINNKSEQDYLKTLDLIPKEDATRLFEKAARLGVGIELNAEDMSNAEKHGEKVLSIFRIAKKCGCKFYLGSDAHDTVDFCGVTDRFRHALDTLGLTEEDKFIPNA